MIPESHRYIVMGGSAGSLSVFKRIFSALPATYRLPIVAVTHLHMTDDGELAGYLNTHSALEIVEAADKQEILPGYVYFSPANYHLLVEEDTTLSLSADKKVNFSRPSIDVLFESASYAWGSALIGILLTGASSDGARGIRTVKRYGGHTVTQHPDEAEFPYMVQAAIETGKVDIIATVDDIIALLQKTSDTLIQQQVQHYE